MSKRQSHNVVLKKEDGGLEFYPMKPWLRKNRQHLPAGFDPDVNTSHELRRALKSIGWGLEIEQDRVLLIKPSDDGDTTFASDILGNDPETEEGLSPEETFEETEVTFGLERDLQSALRANIGQLETGLRIIDDGKERVTEAGRIDITAEDLHGNVVVIELKAGTATPQVIAQVLAYMGAVSEIDVKPVRGILVAGDFHKRVVLATRAVPNLQLKRYSFQFSFEAVK
jgi:hypothetical protein